VSAATKDDMREALVRCASELRVAAWCGMGRAARQPFDPVLAEFAPDWSKQAAVAFEAMEVAGQDPANFSSCRELRPWVGP
jgi:hypothetical protein